MQAGSELVRLQPSACGTATLTTGLKVTYAALAGGVRRRPPRPTATLRLHLHRVAAQLTGALTRAIPPNLIDSSAAVFRKPVRRARHVQIFGDPTAAALRCLHVHQQHRSDSMRDGEYRLPHCTGTNFIFVAAYLGSFDPNNICTNWIGDSGSSPDVGMPAPFSFNVDNGQTFIVVVSEVTPEAGCPAYTFTVTPQSICGGGVSPTPTATATATVTPTATATATVTVNSYLRRLQLQQLRRLLLCQPRSTPTPRPRPTPPPRP